MNSWAETENRFPQDMLLRDEGYKLHLRPRGREAIWEKDGKFFGQAQALSLIVAKEAAINKGRVKAIKEGLALKGGVP